ncbi:Cytochrome P450 [Popillia japonica]|uniref:Cytochrome P450 n=1 Tax=Popillia japonica TaxID=7064 RepID=A0AAW1LRV9_POPJA
MGSSPIVNITDPQYAELLLSNSTHISKGVVYSFVVPWLGDGLLTSKGAKWHRQRKLLTPAFHFKILESFMPIFFEKSKLLVKLLDKEADGKTTFNIFPYITHCTLDIITETAMGIQINAMSTKNNSYVDALYGACGEISNRMATGWLRSDFIFYNTSYGKRFLQYLSTLHGTTNRVVNERKDLRKKQNSNNEQIEDEFGRRKQKAFLDILIDVSEDGTVLTNEQIREEVDTFMFEGHDTTTASISWTLFLLGLHHDVQEQVYQEINDVLQNDKPLEFNNLSDLKYLERVLKESLRMYPSVPTISRTTSADIRIDDYIIPKGSSVAMHIFDFHRNPKYFPQPTKFDPDRFLPENSKDRHPYAFIPFSAGPRNCIGQKFALMEEKIILSYILKNYKVTSTQTVDNVNPVVELILRPHEGLFVTLEKRK